MAESGAVNVERLELVEGELIEKMKNRPHAIVQHEIAKVLYGVFGLDRVALEHTIEVADSDRRANDPVPDLVVTLREVKFYRTSPLPQDISLLVEVSDTTLRYDRTKAALYARAGIVEYWVADLNAARLIVHRTPEGGRYLSVTSYTSDESVASLAAPKVSVSVGAFFE